MSVEKFRTNQFISEVILGAEEEFYKYNNGDDLSDLLIVAAKENLTETEIAYVTILLLEEAEQNSKQGDYQGIIQTYRLGLEALLKTGNHHTETYQQFLQQYNNFIALSIQPR